MVQFQQSGKRAHRYYSKGQIANVHSFPFLLCELLVFDTDRVKLTSPLSRPTPRRHHLHPPKHSPLTARSRRPCPAAGPLADCTHYLRRVDRPVQGSAARPSRSAVARTAPRSACRSACRPARHTAAAAAASSGSARSPAGCRRCSGRSRCSLGCCCCTRWRPSRCRSEGSGRRGGGGGR